MEIPLETVYYSRDREFIEFDMPEWLVDVLEDTSETEWSGHLHEFVNDEEASCEQLIHRYTRHDRGEITDGSFSINHVERRDDGGWYLEVVAEEYEPAGCRDCDVHEDIQETFDLEVDLQGRKIRVFGAACTDVRYPDEEL